MIGSEIENTMEGGTVPLNARWFRDGMYARIAQEGYPGWSRLYARVSTEGVVQTGDRVRVNRRHDGEAGDEART